MKALTIRQPWASLIALGVKTVETRSWSTAYRGPLVIHAGKARPEHLSRVGPWSVLSLYTEPDSGPELRRLGSVVNGELVPDRYERGLAAPMHLGAVVAVVDLVDVVPIVDDWPLDTVAYVRREQRNVTEWWLYNDDTGRCTDVTGQEPYGDFTPGRYAWLLDNVRPVDPPVPAKGRQGLWTFQFSPVEPLHGAPGDEPGPRTRPGAGLTDRNEGSQA